MLRRGVGAKRPLLRANEKQMPGERDFLLAGVYVLQHIPFHLLHVSALLWPSACSAGARTLRLGRGGDMRNPSA